MCDGLKISATFTFSYWSKTSIFGSDRYSAHHNWSHLQCSSALTNIQNSYLVEIKVLSKSLNNQLHAEIPLGNIPSQPLTSICTKQHYLRQALYNRLTGLQSSIPSKGGHLLPSGSDPGGHLHQHWFTWSLEHKSRVPRSSSRDWFMENTVIRSCGDAAVIRAWTSALKFDLANCQVRKSIPHMPIWTLLTALNLSYL